MEQNHFNLRPEIKGIKEESDERRQQEIMYSLDDDKKNGWEFYDSPLWEYDRNFKEVLPTGCETLEEYLNQTYKSRKGALIGVELGGPGNKLFAELNHGFFKKTVGFTLYNCLDRKEEPNHQIIEADVFSRRTKKDNGVPGYQKIEDWININGKADIVIERMVAPIDTPYSDHLLLIIKRWYKILSKEGTIFLELPRDYDYKEDIDVFFKRHETFFDYQEYEQNNDNLARREVAGVYIRLRKLPGAPDSLDELLKTEK